MIACLPFTYIPREHLERMTAHLGPVAVYSPADDLVPDHMRPFIDSGSLELRRPPGLDEKQLVLALEQFRQWAQLHNGSIADMVGFFKRSDGRPPLVEESSTSQITHQIRHFGEGQMEGQSSRLFESALFLAMAQDLDRHQDEMTRDLNGVNSMEKDMLAQLSGDGADLYGGQNGPDQMAVDTGIPDPGLQMTQRRIGAWAELAARNPHPDQLYLTTSQSVEDHLLDLFPEAMPLIDGCMSTAHPSSDIVSTRRAAIAAIASADQPDAAGFVEGLAPGTAGGGDQMRLALLPGCSPRAMLERLLPEKSVPEVGNGKSSDVRNTLIGFFSTVRA
jgi:hypothetical protein